MQITIDIDVGGTFTDCLAAIDDTLIKKKTPTTGYNLSVGVRRVIEDVAGEAGISLEEMLKDVRIVRYSTTLAMNTLIERKGPKLGLITTAGNEHMMLVGRSRQWSDGLHPTEWRDMSKIKKPEPLIPLDMTVGVRERIDCFGKVIMPIDREDVLKKLQYLVDRGARGFVVCLLWSFLNNMHEQIIKEIIQGEYPDIYLGNMVTMLSSEVQPKWHEYPRANVTILNAYLQTEMTEQLSALGEELRQYGYKKPLVVINNVGGMAKVTRTRSVDTYGAGPVAGLFGSRYVGKIYGFKNIVATDMGGTSFDFGLVVDGEVRSYATWPVIDRWATESSMIDVKTIGAGGGSIAWINRTMGNLIEVGPQSAGSNPGPACYDLGGNEPTVTDADVVLGYINPDYFLGGKMRLNKDKAIEAIDRKIAQPLGLTVEAAAIGIKRIIDAKMGDNIAKEVSLKGFDPREFVLFVYGGAGATHCCSYAAQLGSPKIVTFPYASVFCALGGSTTDFTHVYEKSRHIRLYQPWSAEPYLSDYSEFNSVVEDLKQLAQRDLASEGYRPEEITYSLDLDMRQGGQWTVIRVNSPVTALQSFANVKVVCDAFAKEYVARYSEMSLYTQAGIEIQSLYLIASVPLPKPSFPIFQPMGEAADKAGKRKRTVYWQEYGDFVETDIFELGLLVCGNEVIGPAIIEAEDTTYVIPPGWCYTVDKYLNGIIGRLVGK